MRYRNYGDTSLRVSEIFYGTMRYASKTGERDDRSAAAAWALEEAAHRINLEFRKKYGVKAPGSGIPSY